MIEKTKQEHTQTPWKWANLGGGFEVYNSTGRIGFIIAKSDEEAEANADFIVRAINSHEELLEACKLIKSQIIEDVNGNKSVQFNEVLLNKLNDAIANAERE